MSIKLLVVNFWFCYQVLSTSTDQCQPLIWMNYDKMIKLLPGLVFWPEQLLMVFRVPKNFSSVLV
jgi:hypothetical protein